MCGARLAAVGCEWCGHRPILSRRCAVEAEYHREAKGPAVHKALANHLVVSAPWLQHDPSPSRHPPPNAPHAQASMPAVVRAINTAREREAVARLADATAHAAALSRDLEAAGARVATLEAQLADMRAERASTAVARARAEQEAKLAREERAAVADALAEVGCVSAEGGRGEGGTLALRPLTHAPPPLTRMGRRRRSATPWQRG
jgi:hypothetical protein